MNKYIKLSLIVVSIFLIVVFIFFSIICGYYIFYNKNQKFIEIDGIENFNPNDLIDKSSGKNYFLYYPSDIRVSQKYTLIKQVDSNGDIINKYKVYDDKFRRVKANQKILDKDNLYLSLFGEAVLENWFYTFNLSNNTFNRVDLDYFNYDVGVNSIDHQGNDILFSTIATHTTGDQQYNEEKNSFKVSISNFTTKKSYETSYDYIPYGSSGLITFDNKIVYSAMCSNESNKYGIVFIDDNEKLTFFSFDEIENESLSLIYADDTNLYLLSSTSKLIILNKNLEYEIYNISKNYEGYKYSSKLVLDENNILISLRNINIGSSKNDSTILGVLTLKPDIEFNIIDSYKPKNGSLYKLNYIDKNSNIFIIESNRNDNGNVIILDYKN
ncbi:hypothetical protein, partial [uncultured Tyzzerella sp.]|uniref:hypothetical protein n=1 Tax=uncultured Tyzzerella sp. TaxID=2321398 RepID=UPI002943A6D7